MKIWIDLSNSPHPLLFAPITRRLEDEGHIVAITARDNAQTVELARERWPRLTVIGGASPRRREAKAAKIVDRVWSLRRWAVRAQPDVALSHNSYAQIVAARTLGIPVVTAMDFEHQPANHLAFRLAHTILLPEVLPLRAVRLQGARRGSVVRYAGLKEDLYIGDFEPSEAILSEVGLSARPRTLAVVRTPPTRAVYHPSANPLFDDVLRTICRQNGVACVALTRHPEQVRAIERLQLANCFVPKTAIDSRSLIYLADVMVGAGGTMTREAALMGIPTWTMFAGTAPAVDGWLERQGWLCRLHRADQLADIGPRPSPPRTPADLRARGAMVERAFIDATLTAGGSARRL